MCTFLLYLEQPTVDPHPVVYSCRILSLTCSNPYRDLLILSTNVNFISFIPLTDVKINSVIIFLGFFGTFNSRVHVFE